MPAKALLVGINDYAPVGTGGPDLRGCVPDVRDAANTLTALGIVSPNPRNLRILTDGRATKNNIMDGLRWLLTPTAGVDRLIFYYSGHGSQLPNIGSDEEIDGLDETICPHDYATAGMIRDDDFQKLFKSVRPGVVLEAILDSCHSGTGTRDIAAQATLPGDQQITLRYVEPPLDHSFFIDTNPSVPIQAILKAGKRTAAGTREVVVVPDMKWVMWAACRDNQTAAEASIDGTYRGVFSYSYFKVLRRTNGKVSRRKLDTLVSSAVRGMGYSQVPQLEANAVDLGEEVFKAEPLTMKARA